MADMVVDNMHFDAILGRQHTLVRNFRCGHTSYRYFLQSTKKLHIS